MNTNQNKQNAQNANGLNGMLGGLGNTFENAMQGIRNGSSSMVNTVSNMSTGKKLLAVAALALGANMVRKQLNKSQTAGR